MANRSRKTGLLTANTVDPVKTLQDRAALVEWLYAQANAARWGLSRGISPVALERSASKRLASGALTRLSSKSISARCILEDSGSGHRLRPKEVRRLGAFFTKIPHLPARGGAAILRCNARSAKLCDLADSLFFRVVWIGRRQRRGTFALSLLFMGAVR